MLSKRSCVLLGEEVEYLFCLGLPIVTVGGGWPFALHLTTTFSPTAASTFTGFNVNDGASTEQEKLYIIHAVGQALIF